MTIKELYNLGKIFGSDCKVEAVWNKSEDNNAPDDMTFEIAHILYNCSTDTAQVFLRRRCEPVNSGHFGQN